MLNKIESIKKKSMRYYEVSNEFISVLNNTHFEYYIYSEILGKPIIEFSFKDEKRIKEIFKKYSEEKALCKLNSRIDDFTGSIQVDNNYKGHLSMNRIGLITGSNTPFLHNGKPIYAFDRYVASKVMEQVIATTARVDDRFQLEILRTNNDEANLIINGEFRSGNELMQRGNELESEAINLALPLLPMRTKPMFDIFYYNSTYKIGATPDGLFIDGNGEKCVIEVKTKKFDIFIQHLTERQLIKEYYQQMQIEMLVTGAKRAYLVVYYPNFELIIDEVERDDLFLANAMETLTLFNEKYDMYLENISNQYIGWWLWKEIAH